MIIMTNKYVVATKAEPIQFEYSWNGEPDGEFIEDFDEVYLFNDRLEAEQSMKVMDKPDDFEVIEVTISCNI